MKVEASSRCLACSKTFTGLPDRFLTAWGGQTLAVSPLRHALGGGLARMPSRSRSLSMGARELISRNAAWRVVPVIENPVLMDSPLRSAAKGAFTRPAAASLPVLGAAG